MKQQKMITRRGSITIADQGPDWEGEASRLDNPFDGIPRENVTGPRLGVVRSFEIDVPKDGPPSIDIDIEIEATRAPRFEVNRDAPFVRNSPEIMKKVDARDFERAQDADFEVVDE